MKNLAGYPARLTSRAGCLAIALFLSGAAHQARAEDQQRIVAAGGVIAETLYAIGAQDSLVGVDTTSLYPPAALKEKPNVGYVRALSVEGVLSLRPTLLVSIGGAGPAEALAQIGQAGVRIEHLPDAYTPAAVVERIRTLGRLAGAQPAADALAESVATKFSALKKERAALQTRRRVLFLLSLQNGRVMVSGHGTSADAMLALAGLDNAATGFDGYKPMTDEAIIAAAPDAVILMSRGEAVPSADAVFAQPALAMTPAATSKALIVMDGLYLLGFGPRTPDAALDLMRAAYRTDRLPQR